MNDWLRYLAGINDEELDAARIADTRGEAEEWLLTNGLADLKSILMAKSKFFRLPFVLLEGYHPCPNATELLTEEQARKLSLLPLFTVGHHIYVAVSNPYMLP